MTKLNVVKTSYLYWWPKIKDLPIPYPKTEIVKISYQSLVGMLDGKKLSSQYEEKIIKVAEKFIFPIFLRTDMGSAKHSWERTCFVLKIEDLFKHIFVLIDTTLAQGMFGEMDPNALVFREYIEMESGFTAFNGLPISKERRYFIRDGRVQCHHFYWPQEIIESDIWKPPNETNWKDILASLNKEDIEEIELLTKYANMVSSVLDGYWSVDFACSKAGKWYLIDMAEGDKSWHPKH